MFGSGSAKRFRTKTDMIVLMIMTYYYHSMTPPTAVLAATPQPSTDSGKRAAVRPASLAAALPFACAVHCAAAPLLVMALPALAVDPAVELVFLGLSATAGAVSIAASWRLHRKAVVWVAMALGAGVWGASLAGWFQPIPEAATDALGGALLAAGIFWSTRLGHRQRCERCSHQALR